MTPPDELGARGRVGEGEGQSSDLFDYGLLRDYVVLVGGGLRRHRWLALATFVVVGALGLTAVAIFPKTYHVETRILASRNQVIRALGNPHSGVSGEDPTRAAQETVFARDNLVSVIKQTNLVDQWAATRAPVLRLKDLLLRPIHGEMTDEDRLDAMVGTLEKKIKVTTDGNTVTIGVDWPHPQMAYQIVEGAQQNFLETRHVTEISAISEAISILEVHAASMQRSVEQALDDMQKVREARKKGQRVSLTGEGPVTEAAPREVAPAEARPSPPKGGGNEVNEQELAQVKFMIRGKRRAITDLEDFRARRLTELKSQLAEQKVQYSDQHPVVLETKQRISALEQQSPQVAQLRQEEAELLEEYRRKGGLDPESLVEPTRRSSSLRTQATLALSGSELYDDPAVEHARNQLRMANAKYEDLVMRIDAARIELDTARAAFKYRYNVVRPASVPKSAQKPNVPVLSVLVLLFAAGAAVLVGAALDGWRGLLTEPWQVERRLGLAVLAQVPKT